MLAVHLAGSCIITCEQLALSGSMNQHSGGVLMHVLMIPAVLLLSGVKDAGCMTINIVNVGHVMVSHNLKSSDNVIRNQVRQVISYCLIYFRPKSISCIVNVLNNKYR